jgi:microcin C transport system substrate-binding protein
MVAANWAATTFPNPETEFHSKLADVPDTNNITGVKDTRIDELIARYDVEYDQQKRAALIREIDGLLTNLHHYALEWDAPFQRIAYWNKFGHPEGYLSRIDDYYSAAWLWWIDPERERALNRAMADQTVKLDVGPLEIKYWQDYAARTRDKGASGQTVGSVSK